jgi:cyclopropane fatty-acyl-phospholipid synthase-like methyltransferase
MNFLKPKLDLDQISSQTSYDTYNRSAFKKEASFFNKDYFKNGIKSGKSLYDNYRWLPQLTKPLAKAIQEFLAIKPSATVIDYGCARGYLVRALHENGFNAYGVDISSYAINNADFKIKDRLKLISGDTFGEAVQSFNIDTVNYMIAKDVFEHIQPTSLSKLLRQTQSHVEKMYVLVPLGDYGLYRIKEYENDASHVIAENEDWWSNLFEDAGFNVQRFEYKAKGIKEAALPLHPKGNGHFILNRV